MRMAVSGNGAGQHVFQRVLAVFFFLTGALGAPSAATAATLDPALIALAKETTFEVVIPKPDEAGISYDQPINFDLLPFAYRTDKYIPIGTAFALPGGVVATAAHVLGLHETQLYGIPMLRDGKGGIHEIDQIVKYSHQRDFVLFTLKGKPPEKFLQPSTTAPLNDTVFAVGNALGQGIVIRDGAYTSDTPEERDGLWKWMRFSAAASPGNSGGPLLDKDGKVLGIVTAKSPNENLNYALPIAEALNAPDKLAVLNTRGTYVLPNMDFSATGILDHKTELPLSAPALREKLIPAVAKFHDSLLAKLLAQNKDEIFPAGAGSRKLLYTTLTVSAPMVIARKPSGEWALLPPAQEQRADLDANGFITSGQLGNSYRMLRLRKPDNTEAGDYITDSKKLMDAVLKVVPLKRETGYESRRVTSLGAARHTREFRDRYGRVWRAQSWDIPYMFRRLLAYTSPTPDGCIVLLSVPLTSEADDFERDSNVMVDFIYNSYSGTLAEWQTFMTTSAQVPAPLRALKVNYDGGSTLTVQGGDFRLECGAGCMTLSARSRLDTGFAFEGTGEDLRLQPASIGLMESISGDKAARLMKALRPPEELGEAFNKGWSDIVNNRHPIDGEAFSGDGLTKIARALARGGDPIKAKAADENSRFVLLYWQKGEQDKTEFKNRFDALAAKVTASP